MHCVFLLLLILFLASAMSQWRNGSPNEALAKDTGIDDCVDCGRQFFGESDSFTSSQTAQTIALFAMVPVTTPPLSAPTIHIPVTTPAAIATLAINVNLRQVSPATVLATSPLAGVVPATSSSSNSMAVPTSSPIMPAHSIPIRDFASCIGASDCWSQFTLAFFHELDEQERLRLEVVAASKRYSQCNLTDYLGSCLLSAVSLLNEARSNYVVSVLSFVREVDKVDCRSNAVCNSMTAFAKVDLQSKIKSFSKYCATSLCREVKSSL